MNDWVWLCQKKGLRNGVLYGKHVRWLESSRGVPVAWRMEAEADGKLAMLQGLFSCWVIGYVVERINRIGVGTEEITLPV